MSKERKKGGTRWSGRTAREGGRRWSGGDGARGEEEEGRVAVKKEE